MFWTEYFTDNMLFGNNLPPKSFGKKNWEKTSHTLMPMRETRKLINHFSSLYIPIRRTLSIINRCNNSQTDKGTVKHSKILHELMVLDIVNESSLLLTIRTLCVSSTDSLMTILANKKFPCSQSVVSYD